jgi:serine/threonine-protein kinase ATR
LQEKKKLLNEAISGNSRSHNAIHHDFDEIREVAQISSVERILSAIPAAAISRRAVQCRSYARALFHWEQHIRLLADNAKLKQEQATLEEEFKHLQHIYAQIDEPDAVEGISTRLQILDPQQQVLEYKRAGRWTAAQSWYEISLAENPNDKSLQIELFNCLKSSGRYGRHFRNSQSNPN